MGVSYASEAQTIPQTTRTVDTVREYRRAHEQRIVGELVELLSIPNIAADTANIQRNAAKLREMLERRGFRVQFLPIEGRGPVVFGELATPGATRTDQATSGGTPGPRPSRYGPRPPVPIIPAPTGSSAARSAATVEAARNALRFRSLMAIHYPETA